MGSLGFACSKFEDEMAGDSAAERLDEMRRMHLEGVAGLG